MNSKKPVFVAVIGFIMMLFIGVFYAWSLFRIQLVEIFTDWTSAQCSLNFTIFVMCFCCAGFLGGKLSGKIGRRYTLGIGALLVLAGGFLFTTIGNLPSQRAILVVYVAYGLLCGVGSGIAYNVIISGVGLLFSKNAGMISGILLTGFGFGSLLLGIVVEKLIASFPFFTVFRVMTIVIVAIMALGAFSFPRRPVVSSAVGSSLHNDRSLTPAQVLRSPAFWLYMFWVIFMNSAGLLVINSAAVIAASFGAMASLGLIVSLFNGFARIGIGVFFDRFGSRTSILANTGFALAASCLLFVSAVTRAIPLMFLGLILAGISYGSTMALNASVMKAQFGPAHYAVNFSLITLSGIPSSFLGPYVSGVLQDAANGSYNTTFLAMIGFSACAMVFYIFLRRKLVSNHSG